MNSASTNDGDSPDHRRDRQHQQHGADQHGGGEADHHGLLGVQSEQPAAGHPPLRSQPRTGAHDATLFRSGGRPGERMSRRMRGWCGRSAGRWPRIGSRRHEQDRFNPRRRPRHPAARRARARRAHRRAAVPARRHGDGRPPRRDAARRARPRQRGAADDHRAHGVPRLRDDALGGAPARRGRRARRGARRASTGCGSRSGSAPCSPSPGGGRRRGWSGVFGATAEVAAEASVYLSISMAGLPAMLRRVRRDRACCAACRTRARRSGSPASGSPRTSRSTRCSSTGSAGASRARPSAPSSRSGAWSWCTSW